MDTGKVVLGALAGLAAGAVLGILFAPQKGKDTRKKIASKSENYLDEMKDKYNGVIDSLTSKLDMANSKLETAKKEGKNFYDDGKELVEDVNKSIKKF